MKRKLYIDNLFLLIIIFWCSENIAQTPGVWQNYGPIVGNPGITVIIANPLNKSYLYAGTSNRGLYMSSDYGFNWKHASAPMDDKNVTAICLVDNCIYVGTKDNGVFKSEDAGDTWNEESINAILTKEVTSMTCSNDTVYIGISGNGIYYKKITDNAWTKVEKYGNATINIMKSFNGAIFAGKSDGLYYRYRDIWNEAMQLNGKSITSLFSVASRVVIGTNLGVYHGTLSIGGWNFYFEGMTESITSLAIVGNEIYAGTSHGLWYLNESDTMGWNKLQRSGNKTIKCLLYNNKYNTVIVGQGSDGLYYFSVPKRDDPWTPILVTAGKTIESLEAADTEYLYALGSGNELYRSIDGGDSWFLTTEFGNANIKGIYDQGNYLIAFGIDGAFKSTNGGYSWTKIDPFIKKGINAVTKFGDALFVGTTNDGLFSSTDDGLSWQQMSLGNETAVNISSLKSSEKSLYEIAFFGTRGNKSLALEPYAHGVYFKTLYSSINACGPSSIQQLSAEYMEIVKNYIFVEFKEKKSTPIQIPLLFGGYFTLPNWTWEAKGIYYAYTHLNLPSLVPSFQPLNGNFVGKDITSILSIGNSDTLLAGGLKMGILRHCTGNLNDPWTTTNLTDVDVTALINFKNMVYAGANNFGIYRYEKSNDEWKPLAGFPHNGVQIKKFYSVADTLPLFVGTKSHGLFYTWNGNQWYPLNFAFGRTREINELVLSKIEPNKVYAATDNGVYFQTLDRRHPIADSIKINLGSNYTNNSEVSVISFVHDADSMLIYEKSTLSSLKWQLYSIDTELLLSTGDGKKNIYAIFKDISYNFSDTLQASIILDTQLPSRPKIKGADLISTNQRMLRWESSKDTSGIKEYRLELVEIETETPDFLNPDYANSYSLSDSSDFLNIIIPERTGKWFWRIIAVDNAGNKNISDTMMVDSNRPSAPQIISDLEGKTINYTTPIIKWRKKDEAAYYIIEWATNIEFKPSYTHTIKDTTDKLTTKLNGEWFVHLKAINHFQVVGDWSYPPISFKVDTQKPIPLYIKIEDDSAYINKEAVNLKYKVQDDQSDFVRFSNTASFLDSPWDPYDPSTSKSWQLSPGKDGRRIVKVQFKDLAGNISDSLWDDIILDKTPPSIPRLITHPVSPVDSVLLTWQPSADSTSGIKIYRVDCSTAKDFSGTSPSYTISNQTSFKHLGNDTWYWRVTAIDHARNEITSSSDSFLVDTSIPRQPELIWDKYWSEYLYTTNNSKPSFYWKKIDKAAQYLINFSADSLFTIAISDTSFTFSSDIVIYKVPSPLSDGKWYLRVKSISSTGIPSPWSPSEKGEKFIIDTAAPTDVSLFINGNSKFVNTTLVTLNYQARGLTPNYDFIRISNTSIDGVAWDIPAAETRSMSWNLLSGIDGIRSVYIQFKDRAGNISEPASDSIILDQTPPTRPFTESANLIFEAGKPFRKLKWKPSGDNYGLNEYRIEMSEQEPPNFSNSKPGDVVLPTETAKIIAEKTMKWYWRVIAIDTAGNEANSDTMGVDSQDFSTPQILGDINNIINYKNPTLRWNKNDTAYYYEIQWAQYKDFSSSRDTTTQDTTIRLKLKNDGTWFTRVRAFNNFQVCTDWSDPILEFEVDTETPSPLSISIENNAEFTNKDSVDLIFYAEKIGKEDLVGFSNNGVFDASSWEAYTSGEIKKWPLSEGNDGIRTVYIQLKDEAGNISDSLWDDIILDQTPPTSPELLPPILVQDQSAKRILAWKKSTDSTSGLSRYRIEWSPNMGFAEFVNLDSIYIFNADTIEYRTPILGDTIWYWRVTAIDEAGNENTSFDETLNFEINTDKPDIPDSLALVSSDSLKLTNNPVPFFTWTKIDEAVKYYINFARNRDFTAHFADTTAVPSYTVSDSLSDGTWYVRVKSINSSGLESNWSSTAEFTIDTVSPDEISLKINNDSTYVNRLSVMLKFNARGASLSDSVHFSNADNFTNIPWEPFADKTLSWNLTDGPDGIRKVYVEFKDQAGNISTVASDSIILDRTAPTISEIDTVMIASQNKRILRWKPSSDTTSRIKAYHLLTTDKTDTLYHTVKGDSVQCAINLYDQKWFWQVRAIDQAGNVSPYSRMDSFLVVDQKPDIPMVQIDSSITNNNKPTIKWTKSERAKIYSLQYTTSPNFINSQTIPELTTTCYTFTQGLADGTYYFRAFAKNMASVSSDTSASVSLTIDTQPPSDLKMNVASGAKFTKSDSVSIHLSAIGANWVKLLGDFIDDELMQYKQFKPFDINEKVRTQFLVKLIPGDGLKNLQAVFTDSAGNTAEIQASLFLDTQQPVFTSFSPLVSDTLPALNRSITINFNSPIDGGSGIKSFRLLCRRTGDPAEAILPLKFQNDIIEIPDFMVTNLGIDYQIITEDSAGNQTILQNSSPDGTLDFFSLPVSIGTREAGSSEGLPGGSDGASYRLVSLPLMTAGIKASEAFTSLGNYGEKKDYRIWRYQGNSLWQEGANLILQPGESYFLIKRKSGPLSNNCPGTSTKGSDAALGKIKAWQLRGNGDWTMVGNPFNFDIPLAQLWLKSCDSCIVSSSNMDLWSFIGSEDSSGWTQDFSVLKKWNGMAVRNAGEADVMIYKPPYYDIPLPISLPKKQTLDDWLAKSEGEDINAWMVQIKARCGNYHDNENYFGVCELAKDGNDCFDSYEPPLLPDGISLFFTDENGKVKRNLASDIRPVNDRGYEWNLNIKSTRVNKATLRFERCEFLPQDYEIYLIDQPAKILRDLRQQNGFEVYIPQSPKIKTFKILVGDKNFVNEHSDGLSSIPDRFALYQNHPNPFNKSTVIRYSMPIAGKVALRIYNLMGKEILKIEDKKDHSPGHYEMVIDFANYASGVYFYQVSIRGEKHFNAVKKMIFVK